MSDVADDQSPTLIRVDEDVFRVGDTTFTAAPFKRFASTADHFCIVKPPHLVERYATLVDELRPRRIVELGICKGGSTAFLAALARPEALLAIELDDRRIEALDVFLADQGLEHSVQAAYGIDQSDRELLDALLDATMGATPLDLVVDDASHDLQFTRASFNVLFPRLRPGGLFIIEDWSWAHLGYEAQRLGAVPLTTLVFEAVLAVPYRAGLIDDVLINREWAVIRRGPKALDPGEFDISACYGDRGRDLVTPLARGVVDHRASD